MYVTEAMGARHLLEVHLGPDRPRPSTSAGGGGGNSDAPPKKVVSCKLRAILLLLGGVFAAGKEGFPDPVFSPTWDRGHSFHSR